MNKLAISQVDTIFANGSYPIEFLFHFPARLNAKKIRSALKTLSAVFWPAFGEYAAGFIVFEKYSEKDCFEEVIVDREFRRDDPPETIYETYRRSIPSPAKRLFFLKMIQSSDGTLLIAKMNHLAGDGHSYFHFLSALAAISRSGMLPFKKYLLRALYKPHHSRTALKEFHFLGRPAPPLADPEKLEIEFRRISKLEVQNIIKRINSDFQGRASSNDVLSAMGIKKLAKVREWPFREALRLTIPMDIRRQVKEYGPKYFGNGLMFHNQEFKISDLEKSGTPELAIDIRKEMPTVTKEVYLDYLSGIEAIIAAGQSEKLRPYDPRSGCLVTNLSKLPASKLDFGTGVPDFVFPLTIEKNSAAILADRDDFILRFAY